ncbi:MAG: dihydroorotate dehydrogenase [Candidatus Zapsychrus exili]|nr:dihydroorotate dehydrogenase [Candidatus Zapsychrus exili]
MNLKVKIGKLKFSNPVTVASGTFSYMKEYSSIAEIKKLGAVVAKTITLNAREGNPSPRIVETAAGMVNAIGIENRGADYFIETKLPELKKLGVPLVVSVSAKEDKELISLVKKLNKAKGIAAIELNLSCPNLKHKTLVAQDKYATYRVIKAVKKATKLPIIAKLSPNVTDIVLIAKSAERAGADALSLVNTFSAMVIDIDKRKSKIGNFTGGLSGPAIKPIAVKMVYDVAQTVKIPIIAMGGIMNADDALEFIIAGASMVAVGTANFVNPSAPKEILAGIKSYMKKNKIRDIKKLIGSIKKG